MMKESRLVYVYAEYCPGDLFCGWWIYFCNIRYGLPDRNNKKHDAVVWLNKYEWMIRQLFSELKISVNESRRDSEIAKNFIEAFPIGVIMRLVGNREFEKPSADEVKNIELWRLSKRVKELQMLGWKHGEEDTTKRILEECNRRNERITDEIHKRNNRRDGIMVAMFKDGKPYESPSLTERQLLIGFDFMPLRGLEKTKKYLEEKGITSHTVRPYICTNGGEFDAFTISVNGKIDVDIINWGCWDETESVVLHSAVFYFMNEWKLHENMGKDRKVLVDFFVEKSSSKKIKSLAEKAREVLLRNNIEIIKAKIKPIEKK